MNYIDAGTLSALSIIITTIVNVTKPLFPEIDPRIILLILAIISSVGYGFLNGNASVDEYIQIVMASLSAVGLYEVVKTKQTNKITDIKSYT